MSKRDFLIEIGTEELPPKSLRNLSASFESGITNGLKKELLNYTDVKSFATPRRLAVLISALDEKQKDKSTEKFGPAVKTAFDADGKPTPAAKGFAKSCGVEVSQLITADKDGVEKLSYTSNQVGKTTIELLPGIIDAALAKLPIPKRMRWGASRDEFVRPVHWVVMLFGDEIINTNIMGVDSGRQSFGHRFHHPESIQLNDASEYESRLESPGNVIADFTKRKSQIRTLIEKEGEKLNATTVVDESLLDEVTSLVEFPVALTGNFDELFLDVPAEALILAMKSHQKCFYLVGKEKSLLPHFVTVSNIRSKDPAQVTEGNERVIRPRLADAKFFYETDQKQTLESRLEKLKKVVFQEKLGTVYERSLRIAKLAKFIAAAVGENEAYCERAAVLSKCDLVSNMVGEFADLQGLMGSYYALNDGEPEQVATAINEQYMPKFAGDSLPSSATGSILALADKLDSIVGLFAIGQPPTGSKDPFALRRSAIGVLRILVENEINLDLIDAINASIQGFEGVKVESCTADNVFEFMLERFRSWYMDEGVSSNVFQAVMALKPRKPLDFSKRIIAVSRFTGLEQSAALAAANKRVSNLLDKAENISLIGAVDTALFEEAAEKHLFDELETKEVNVAPLFSCNKYTEGLDELCLLKDAVDRFFDDVLVMCEDKAVQNNRLALLQRLRSVFLQVADISYLHTS
jgi:glycyl-tRNA synthetase beta chain